MLQPYGRFGAGTASKFSTQGKTLIVESVPAVSSLSVRDAESKEETCARAQDPEDNTLSISSVNNNAFLFLMPESPVGCGWLVIADYITSGILYSRLLLSIH